MKREFTLEHRQKMAESARKRWEERRAAQPVIVDVITLMHRLIMGEITIPEYQRIAKGE